jgi:hypothetical protein
MEPGGRPHPPLAAWQRAMLPLALRVIRERQQPGGPMMAFRDHTRALAALSAVCVLLAATPAHAELTL